MKILSRFRLWLRYRWGVSVTHRKMRKQLRSKDFKIYTTRLRAISRAKTFTYNEKQVYWVMKEEVGYYVVNLEDVARLNNHSMKKKGAKKIQTRYLDQKCAWRSPKYSNL